MPVLKVVIGAVAVKDIKVGHLAKSATATNFFIIKVNDSQSLKISRGEISEQLGDNDKFYDLYTDLGPVKFDFDDYNSED